MLRSVEVYIMYPSVLEALAEFWPWGSTIIMTNIGLEHRYAQEWIRFEKLVEERIE